MFSNDGSQDKDTREDGTGHLVSDGMNAVGWSIFMDGQWHNGSGSLSYTFNETGYYSAKAKIDDKGNHGADDGWCTIEAAVDVLPVDYVIVLPNPTHCAPEEEIVFTGHAYNYGEDYLPYFDQYGQAIDGRADDDIKLGATFDWTTNIGSVDPEEDSASTTFTADAGTGTGSVTATYNKCGNIKSGSAAVFVEIVTAELGGPNGGDIMNIPINAAVSESMGGTGWIGEVKGKVTIEGSPYTEYDALLSAEWSGDDSGRISFPWCVGITTNGNGVGEAEFIITAQRKSLELGDITFKVEIMYGDNVLTDCEQDLTVYEIKLEKGDVGGSDKQLDSRVSGDTPNSQDFELTIPTNNIWPNKVWEGDVDTFTFLGMELPSAKSIRVRPEPNEIGGGSINASNLSLDYGDHDNMWLFAYQYVRDCEIKVVTDPEDAYSGRLKGRPYIRATVKFYYDVHADSVSGTSYSHGFSISVPLGGGSVGFSWSESFPTNIEASAVAMVVMGVKFPFASAADKREVKRWMTNLQYANPDSKTENVTLIVSPEVDTVLQVGSNPTLFSLGSRTEGKIVSANRAVAEARYYGFKHNDTQVRFQSTGLELVPSSQ